eukprot:547022-Prymnesium_polylepis.2
MPAAATSVAGTEPRASFNSAGGSEAKPRGSADVFAASRTSILPWLRAMRRISIALIRVPISSTRASSADMMLGSTVLSIGDSPATCASELRCLDWISRCFAPAATRNDPSSARTQPSADHSRGISANVYGEMPSNSEHSMRHWKTADTLLPAARCRGGSNRSIRVAGATSSKSR